MSMMKKTALPLMLLCLLCAGCATTGGGTEEPTVTEAAPAAAVAEAIEAAAPPAGDRAHQAAEPVIVKATRHQVIHDLVAEGQTLLRDVELQYFFTGKGKNPILRGRPV